MSNEGVQRHNSISLCIMKFIRLTGHDAKYEPAKLIEEDKKRPDVQFVVDGKLHLIDVTCKQLLAPSHIIKSSKEQGAILNTAVKEKHDHYEQMIQQLDANFTAFAVDVFGGMHKESLALIDKIK